MEDEFEDEFEFEAVNCWLGGMPAMAEVSAEFTEEQVALLKEEAGRRGLSLEALTREEALELLAQRDREFDAALEAVLEKNRELYRRLA